MIETYCRTCNKPMKVRNNKELRQAERNVRICESCFDAFDGLTMEKIIDSPAHSANPEHTK